MSSTSTEDIIETMAESEPPNYGTVDTSALVEEGLRHRRSKWYHGFLTKTRPGVSTKEHTPDENPEGSLSTLNGVTIPTCLSMFSSLLFLRVGYVIGNAGLLYGLLQLFISYVILCCTVCSISAIATNGSVKGGGVYFMISRTLGPQLGGSVGVLFYAANVVSGALYASGFAETLLAVFGPFGQMEQDEIPGGKWYKFGYASGVLGVCLIISLIGAKAFSKCTIIFAFLLFVSVSNLGVSFTQNDHIEKHWNETVNANCTVNCTYQTINGSFSGLSYHHGQEIAHLFKESLWAGFERSCESRREKIDFFGVFGVLFAGVTGIMAGANVSGELKNPSHSIPKGTFTACAISFAVYVLVFFATATTSDRNLLYRDCFFMITMQKKMWAGGYIILFGALLASFCACLNCLIGASRVVEALVSDTMFGELAYFFFGRMKIGNNPILSVFLTFVAMLLALMVGSLNKIAQLSSVLFLLSYFTVNLACLFLEWASAPNFRPKFRGYNFVSCIIGCVGCFSMMIVISPLFTAVSWLLLFLCIGIFSFTSGPKYKEWGSIGQALIFHQVRKYLLMMDVRKDHVKFWRPQILYACGNPRYNCVLIDFINALKKSGLYIIGHVRVDDFDKVEARSDPSVVELPHWLALIDHLKVKAFPEITMAKSMREGVQQLARISGIGAMKPNTVVLGFGHEENHCDQLGNEDSIFYKEGMIDHFDQCGINENPEEPMRNIELMKTVSDMLRLEKNVCLARNFPNLTKERKKYVDVWLIDFFAKPNFTVSNPGQSFMMQLGTILTMTQEWKSFQLRVFIRVMAEEDKSTIVKQVEHILFELRIPANVVTIEFKRIFSIVEDSGAVLGDSESLDLMSIPDAFMTEINQVIKTNSKDTAVTFLRLPEPPRNLEKEALRMYQLLKIQSDNLPPVMYVHGIKTVVSSSL